MSVMHLGPFANIALVVTAAVTAGKGPERLHGACFGLAEHPSCCERHALAGVFWHAGNAVDQIEADLVLLSTEAVHSKAVDANLLAEFVDCPGANIGSHASDKASIKLSHASCSTSC